MGMCYDSRIVSEVSSPIVLQSNLERIEPKNYREWCSILTEQGIEITQLNICILFDYAHAHTYQIVTTRSARPSEARTLVYCCNAHSIKEELAKYQFI